METIQKQEFYSDGPNAALSRCVKFASETLTNLPDSAKKVMAVVEAARKVEKRAEDYHFRPTVLPTAIKALDELCDAVQDLEGES